jgi:hypothetical protein
MNFASIFSPIFDREKTEGGHFSSKAVQSDANGYRRRRGALCGLRKNDSIAV